MWEQQKAISHLVGTAKAVSHLYTKLLLFFLLKICFSQVEHLPALGHAVGETEQGRHDDQEPLTPPQ